MAEPKSWITRFARCVDNWFERLNQGNEDRPFRILTIPDRRDLMFGLTCKPTGGQRLHPDGSRWKNHLGPTWRQGEILEQTSADDEELIARLHKFVIDGIDTTRQYEQPRMTEAMIDARVQERVEQIMRQKLAEIMANPENVAAIAASQNLKPLPTEPGHQPDRVGKKPREHSSKRYAELRKAENEMWEKRRRLMGFRPIEYNVYNKPKKLWLRAATAAWADYCSEHPQDAQAAPAVR